MIYIVIKISLKKKNYKKESLSFNYVIGDSVSVF